MESPSSSSSSSSRSIHNDAHSRYGNVNRSMQSTQAVILPTTAKPTATAAAAAMATITSNVNTKLRPITSKSPSNQVAHDSLKLTLIQTNGHSFVANKYPDSFSTHHFNRWPNVPQSSSSSIDYNIKWKTANNPFASHFNPSIETIPATAAAPAASPYRPPQYLPSSTIHPTINVYRTYTDHRVHVHKHHTGHGYVSQCDCNTF